MRRIDLTCLIVAPVAVGFLMTFGGSRAAVAAICLWNLVVWVPEVALLSYSIRQAPHLRWTPARCAFCGGSDCIHVRQPHWTCASWCGKSCHSLAFELGSREQARISVMQMLMGAIDCIPMMFCLALQ